MTTVKEAPKRILELVGSLCELHFPFGQAARVKPAVLSKPPGLQKERQLRLLKWKCTYKQAGCFKSMFLTQSPEDAEE